MYYAEFSSDEADNSDYIARFTIFDPQGVAICVVTSYEYESLLSHLNRDQ